jgi:rhodanese-related sulfurtransferase
VVEIVSIVDEGLGHSSYVDESTDRPDLVRQCLTVGHDTILGELDGGLDTWTAAGLPVASIPVVDAHGLDGTVLDVRQDNEWDAGHVPGAIHVELGDLTTATVPDGPVTVMCGHGERAMTAASLLEAGGHHRVAVLAGGPADWSAATGTALQIA